MEHDILGKIEFPDNEYSVKQSLVRNKYEVSDSAGNVVLKTKQKLFKMKEEFPFTDPDGNKVFTIKAQNIMDIAGDYAIIDEETGETKIILSKNFTLFRHTWKIKKPGTEELIAKVQDSSLLLAVLRDLSDLISIIPHKYVITDPEENEIGSIEGKFSLKDQYTISVDEDLDHGVKEAVIASSIAIDALEGN